MKVSWSQALAWRVDQQLLRSVAAADPVEVARRVAGVQAQLMSAAELGIGLRSGATPAGTQQALWRDRTLTKTWAMRGTLHLFPSDELPLWTAALRDKERSIKR